MSRKVWRPPAVAAEPDWPSARYEVVQTFHQVSVAGNVFDRWDAEVWPKYPEDSVGIEWPVQVEVHRTIEKTPFGTFKKPVWQMYKLPGRCELTKRVARSYIARAIEETEKSDVKEFTA